MTKTRPWLDTTGRCFTCHAPEEAMHAMGCVTGEIIRWAYDVGVGDGRAEARSRHPADDGQSLAQWERDLLDADRMSDREQTAAREALTWSESAERFAEQVADMESRALRAEQTLADLTAYLRAGKA